MIPPSTPASLESIRPVDAVEGFWLPVKVSGPDNGRVVVMFDETSPETAAFDAVRQRLHAAMLRTVVIPMDRGLTAKSVVGVLDRLGLPPALLVGDRAGGELAWNVAATEGERLTGLVVIDSGHPRVSDTNGVIRDQHCPPVHADTTALVSTPAAHAVGRASRRYVHGEFRLTELAGRRKSPYFTAQLAAEIVLRSHSW